MQCVRVTGNAWSGSTVVYSEILLRGQLFYEYTYSEIIAMERKENAVEN